jgi:hypothetical protein
MKIKDLKQILNNLPDDMEVILQKDSEGNGYSPLSGCDSNCIYIKESDWSGDVYSTNWSAIDADCTDKEWEDMKMSNPKVLVLYPVN